MAMLDISTRDRACRSFSRPLTTMVWTPPGFRCGMMAASADAHQRNQEETEMDATTVAVDLAKTAFQVVIADRHAHIVRRHRLNRQQFARFLTTLSPTHVVMEACGTAHYWGRCAGQHGHRVTLLPPAYVRPYFAGIRRTEPM